MHTSCTFCTFYYKRQGTVFDQRVDQKGARVLVRRPISSLAERGHHHVLEHNLVAQAGVLEETRGEVVVGCTVGCTGWGTIGANYGNGSFASCCAFSVLTGGEILEGLNAVGEFAINDSVNPLRKRREAMRRRCQRRWRGGEQAGIAGGGRAGRPYLPRGRGVADRLGSDRLGRGRRGDAQVVPEHSASSSSSRSSRSSRSFLAALERGQVVFGLRGSKTLGQKGQARWTHRQSCCAISIVS